MATSTEQINALIAGYTDLKAFFEGNRQAHEQARANLPGQIRRVIHVDEQNGFPGNDGSAAQPLPSISDAIQSLVQGQNAEIRMLTDCTWGTKHYIGNMAISIVGYDAVSGNRVKRRLSFSPTATNHATGAAGIVSSGVLNLNFRMIELIMPDNPPSHADQVNFSGTGLFALSFVESDVIGTDGDGDLIFTWGAAWTLGLAGSTFTDMEGRWVQGIAAGTPLTVENSRILNANLLVN